MGLAAPKNRMKLSHDPNNTRWHGNKESFGHKIMASQGWKEGQYLGAVDANHAEHYTAANASHIKVSIKDDNLGLGAKIGSGVGAGECTGLDAFKNILGRLNGKDEDEIEKEQRSRDDLKRAIYTEKKWGSVRFVRGGFLIGDKIQDLIAGEAERIQKLELGDSTSSDDSSSSDSDPEVPATVEASKSKRKVDIVEDAGDIELEAKRSKKRKLDAKKKPIPEVVAVKVKKSKKQKKDKKERKSRSELVVDHEASNTDSRESEKSERRQRKEKKRARKARKEKELEEGKSKKKSKDKQKNTLGQALDSSANESKPLTPSTSVAGSGRSTPMMQGRHAVRSRNIAQKRLASMDIAALNQIFMIKTPS